MFDENSTGAFSIRFGAIFKISGSIIASSFGGPPPVSRYDCLSLVKASLWDCFKLAHNFFNCCIVLYK